MWPESLVGEYVKIAVCQSAYLCSVYIYPYWISVSSSVYSSASSVAAEMYYWEHRDVFLSVYVTVPSDCMGAGKR
jgi:hypothetical protein